MIPAERDLHIADCVLQGSGQRTVLVVSLVHMAGVERHLRETGGYCTDDRGGNEEEQRVEEKEEEVGVMDF